MYCARFAALAVVTLVAPLMSSPASAARTRPEPRPVAASDTRELDRTHFTLGGRALPEHPRYHPRPVIQGRPIQGRPVEDRPIQGHSVPGRAAKATTPAVGTVREWLGLNDVEGQFYRKNYQLRAVGKHIEVWVAQDIDFPATDCRKNAVEVTDAEASDMVREFDDNMYPKETAAFSTPPDRDGSRPQLTGDFTGDGNKTVTLVDNVRDQNYFHYPQAVTYIAGFFSAQLNELFDRNVMTIDAYDWRHRLGAEPADDPTGDLCTSRPAHPRMYEATFAHEWQHLLEYYADPAEVSWINEGLSDFAQTLTGYVDGRMTVNDPANDIHLACFQGFGPVKSEYNANPRDCGGPQNSLNLWNEGGANDVLADYGNAYQFMLYLSDRFGLAAISLLHRDGLRHGLAGLQAALPTGTDLYDVVHDYQTMTLVDKTVGGSGGEMIGVPLDRVTAPGLRSTVNLASKSAYDAPGAAPNGADYVPLPTPVQSVSFLGARTLPPLPTGWSVADQTLFSGNADNLDSYAIRTISVPAGSPVLQLETAYDNEEAYDFGYVTISTDGGETFQTLAGDRTAAGPLGPGLTGASGQVVTASYELQAYAGKRVLLGLRYVSDFAVNRGGWRIGKITLAGRTISDGTTFDDWRSPSALHPVDVHAWHVTLVGIDGTRARMVPVEQYALLQAYPKVVAIVAFDEPTETVTQYAPYRLVVNGVLQPGGGTP